MKKAIMKRTKNYRFGITLAKGTPVLIHESTDGVLTALLKEDDVVRHGVTPKDFDYLDVVSKKQVSRLKKQIKTVTTKLTVVSIPENALLHGVVKLLEGREAFKDTDSELDENMYAGHIFEDIAGEQAEIEDGHFMKAPQKVLDQLDALAELVSQDYVLITKV